MKIWPGEPYPPGATWDGIGVNFALFSENATGVDLCLFDSPESERESAKIKITNQTDLIWRAYLPEVLPNQIDGYRVYGPYEPEEGHRFNPSKLLLDPYAKAIAGFLTWDPSSYYRLMPDSSHYYMDYTGCGNSLNMRHPQVLQYVMDSLRYWVTEMHVDGFRFDLAATLARELHEVDRLSAFFDIINQDPVLSQVKLIAEPWDLGEGGYQVGRFPPKRSEWNGKYRDTIREFWKGRGCTIGEFGYRFTGSVDLYAINGRRPSASINFVTAHDGFTLHDLVSYNEKHNEANGEANKDGTADNRSWNCGEEGPTENPEANALRARQARNFLATLFLSQGVPMLHHGDEIGHTKYGNNNTYCQDNELSWFDWQNADQGLLKFVKNLIQLRTEHPVFRRQLWFRPSHTTQLPASEIGWFRFDGKQMQEEDWQDNLTFGVYLNGRKIRGQTPKGEPIIDDSFCILINGHYEDIDFILPPADWGGQWVKELDTNKPVLEDVDTKPIIKASEPIHVASRSLIVLRYVE